MDDLTEIRTLDVQEPIGEGWDERWCGVCGDEIEADQESVNEPCPEISERAVIDAHTWCAVKNGYRLRWSGGNDG